MTLALPITDIAVAIHIGEAEDIYPRNKMDVGLRLALRAIYRNYRHSGVILSGPLFRSEKREGSSLRLSFDHIGGGLVCLGDLLGGFTIP